MRIIEIALRLLRVARPLFGLINGIGNYPLDMVVGDRYEYQ